MKINYIWLVIIIIIIFMVNKHINKNEQQNVSNDKGDVNKQTISPLKETIRNAIIKSQTFEISKENIALEIDERKKLNPDHSKDIDNYFKKPSNRSRLGDDLMEKKILAYLKEFAKIKEVNLATKDLRKQSEVKS